MSENCITKIAKAHDRDYITPEDVSEAFLRGVSQEMIMRDLLRVIGKQEQFGVEDPSLCAYLAGVG